uniref:GNAT family N-acetyltransferase n=1 Tax=Roseihalotalea indica TaxID=2867963 RepID=A0AA49GP35_9BACT|nr:GNAT family N-acetyltransferase [Tunicatimonas sp. TK19036]
MITYREATSKDAEAIAQLHAQSWQQHYRGIMSDTYLDHKVLNDRIEVWQERFRNPKATQHIIVATEDEKLCGFACTYTDDDPKWGTLLDNLHVLPPWQGRSIGKALICQSAKWAQQQDAETGFYLWVFEENTAARAFYERMGGINQEKVIVNNPDGGTAPVFRYVWPDPTVLINHLQE